MARIILLLSRATFGLVVCFWGGIALCNLPVFQNPAGGPPAYLGLALAFDPLLFVALIGCVGCICAGFATRNSERSVAELAPIFRWFVMALVLLIIGNFIYGMPPLSLNL